MWLLVEGDSGKAAARPYAPQAHTITPRPSRAWLRNAPQDEGLSEPGIDPALQDNGSPRASGARDDE